MRTKNSAPFVNLTDSTVELEQAIDQLNHFAQENLQSTAPLSKTILLFSHFINKKKISEPQQIIKAISVVQQHYPLILKDPSKQVLVKSILTTVKNFNTYIEKQKQVAPLWTEWITSFFHSKPPQFSPIELPRNEAFEFDKIKKIQFNQRLITKLRELDQTSQKIIAGTLEPTSENIKDAFRLKAVQKVEKLFPTSAIARYSVKFTPIKTKLEDSTMHLSQVLTTAFPGEVIEVKSSLKINPQQERFIVPKDFTIDIQYHPQSCPHPAQRHGRALPEELIDLQNLVPNAPLNLNIQNKKNEILTFLLNPSVHEKAKVLLELKKTIFDDHKMEFLCDHQKLSEAIFGSAEPIISLFFDMMRSSDLGYEYFAEVHHLINKNFICFPLGQLNLRSQLEHTPGQLAQNFSKILDEIQCKFEEWQGQTEIEQQTIRYMQAMGSHLGRLVYNLYLNQDNVKNPNSCKIHRQALTEFEDFYSEILFLVEDEYLWKDSSRLYLEMKDQIHRDILFFTET